MADSDADVHLPLFRGIQDNGFAILSRYRFKISAEIEGKSRAIRAIPLARLNSNVGGR